MKRFLQSMFLLVAMIMTTANANAWKFTSVSPANNSQVTQLYTISLGLSGAYVDEFSATAQLECPDGTTVTYNFNALENPITGTPSDFKALTAPGTYTLKLNSSNGNFHLGGVAMESQEFTWTIGGGQTETQPGEDMDHAKELQFGASVENMFKPVEVEGRYQYWFKCTATKDGIVRYTVKDAAVISGSYTQNGLTTNGITNNQFEVEKDGVYYFCLILNDATVGTISISIADKPVSDLIINEDDAEAVEKIKENYGKTVNFKSDRKLSADHWNTLCLPYDVATSDFAEIIQVTDIIEIEDNMFAVTFSKMPPGSTEVWAGNPIIVKAKTNNQSIDKAKVKIQEGCADENALIGFRSPGFGFCGVYAPTTLNGMYYINNNRFYYADIDITMKGFRAYIEVPSDVANVRSFAINIEDGATTAIEEMQATGAKSATVTYDLSGKVVKAKKGIVIENGKKVMY